MVHGENSGQIEKVRDRRFRLSVILLMSPRFRSAIMASVRNEMDAVNEWSNRMNTTVVTTNGFPFAAGSRQNATDRDELIILAGDRRSVVAKSPDLSL